MFRLTPLSTSAFSALSRPGRIAKLAAPLLLGGAVLAAAQTTSVHHARRHLPIHQAATCPPAPVVPAGVPAVEGPVQTAFALRYVDTKVGTGAEAAAGDPVTVHYTGWLASDGSKFDSSVDRGQPFSFTLGARSVIPGWDQGFKGMRVGGKRRLFIPYQLAYGDEGRPPVIPPKNDLIFDVELLAAGANPPDASPAPPQPASSPQP